VKERGECNRVGRDKGIEREGGGDKEGVGVRF
jgi:hypothetical protein